MIQNFNIISHARPGKEPGRFQETVYKRQTDSVFKTESACRDEYKRYVENIQLPE